LGKQLSRPSNPMTHDMVFEKVNSVHSDFNSMVSIEALEGSFEFNCLSLNKTRS
jgi:hypothetical protein